MAFSNLPVSTGDTIRAADFAESRAMYKERRDSWSSTEYTSQPAPSIGDPVESSGTNWGGLNSVLTVDNALWWANPDNNYIKGDAAEWLAYRTAHGIVRPSIPAAGDTIEPDAVNYAETIAIHRLWIGYAMTNSTGSRRKLSGLINHAVRATCWQNAYDAAVAAGDVNFGTCGQYGNIGFTGAPAWQADYSIGRLRRRNAGLSPFSAVAAITDSRMCVSAHAAAGTDFDARVHYEDAVATTWISAGNDLGTFNTADALPLSFDVSALIVAMPGDPTLQFKDDAEAVLGDGGAGNYTDDSQVGVTCNLAVEFDFSYQ
jgi:hypothetical protein